MNLKLIDIPFVYPITHNTWDTERFPIKYPEDYEVFINYLQRRLTDFKIESAHIFKGKTNHIDKPKIKIGDKIFEIIESEDYVELIHLRFFPIKIKIKYWTIPSKPALKKFIESLQD